jgi:L-fuconate dehydratase
MVRELGYPAYVTSAGWLGASSSIHLQYEVAFTHHPPPTPGYSDAKITSLTKAALDRGFTHFKMKVGASQPDDLRRGLLIRSLIDDPALVPEHLREERLREGAEAKAVVGKNAGRTGCVLMVDANQVWEVGQAVEWVRGLEAIRPW